MLAQVRATSLPHITPLPVTDSPARPTRPSTPIPPPGNAASLAQVERAVLQAALAVPFAAPKAHPKSRLLLLPPELLAVICAKLPDIEVRRCTCVHPTLREVGRHSMAVRWQQWLAVLQQLDWRTGEPQAQAFKLSLLHLWWEHAQKRPTAWPPQAVLQQAATPPDAVLTQRCAQLLVQAQAGMQPLSDSDPTPSCMRQLEHFQLQLHVWGQLMHWAEHHAAVTPTVVLELITQLEHCLLRAEATVLPHLYDMRLAFRQFCEVNVCNFFSNALDDLALLIGLSRTPQVQASLLSALFNVIMADPFADSTPQAYVQALQTFVQQPETFFPVMQGSSRPLLHQVSQFLATVGVFLHSLIDRTALCRAMQGAHHAAQVTFWRDLSSKLKETQQSFNVEIERLAHAYVQSHPDAARRAHCTYEMLWVVPKAQQVAWVKECLQALPHLVVQPATPTKMLVFLANFFAELQQGGAYRESLQLVLRHMLQPCSVAALSNVAPTLRDVCSVSQGLAEVSRWRADVPAAAAQQMAALSQELLRQLTRHLQLQSHLPLTYNDTTTANYCLKNIFKLCRSWALQLNLDATASALHARIGSARSNAMRLHLYELLGCLMQYVGDDFKKLSFASRTALLVPLYQALQAAPQNAEARDAAQALSYVAVDEPMLRQILRVVEVKRAPQQIWAKFDLSLLKRLLPVWRDAAHDTALQLLQSYFHPAQTQDVLETAKNVLLRHMERLSLTQKEGLLGWLCQPAALPRYAPLNAVLEAAQLPRPNPAAAAELHLFFHREANFDKLTQYTVWRLECAAELVVQENQLNDLAVLHAALDAARFWPTTTGALQFLKDYCWWPSCDTATHLVQQWQQQPEAWFQVCTTTLCAVIAHPQVPQPYAPDVYLAQQSTAARILAVLARRHAAQLVPFQAACATHVYDVLCHAFQDSIDGNTRSDFEASLRAWLPHVPLSALVQSRHFFKLN